MATRLRSQFPELADALQAVDEDEQAGLVERIASEAASMLGLVVPDVSVEELGQWVDALDDAGWTTDSAGEPVQDQTSFLRARAASAVRNARDAGARPEAAADSLYESAIAIGLPAVRAHLP